MVNHYYFYCVDRDFGPFFVKFGSYFPYNGKLCLNGHEYAKRQLDKRNIDYEALDNGFQSCADPKQLHRICDGLTDRKINALARKWFARLPHPFPAKDRHPKSRRYQLTGPGRVVRTPQRPAGSGAGQCAYRTLRRRELPGAILPGHYQGRGG